MKFFISWEHYSSQWELLEKGYHFLEVTNPRLIDIDLGDYLEQLAEAREVDLRYVVPISCQQIPSFREENEPWQPSNPESEELDPLFNEAVEYVVKTRRASVSGVQRQLRIGYARASRIVQQMECQGIVSRPDEKNGNREVL